jgi:hypothetical protein
MTTIAADGNWAACDSLWCDHNGEHVEPPDIRKYLFIEQDLSIEGVRGEHSLAFFCGDIEPIVLHQMFILGLISESTLEDGLVMLTNKISRKFQFGYFSIQLPSWEIVSQQGIESSGGLVFGGTGGGIVCEEYQKTYDLIDSVHLAIAVDSRSGLPLVKYNRQGVSVTNAECITSAGCDSLNQYFDEYFRWQEETMTATYKHAGYKTSMATEAPELNIKEHMKKLKASVHPKMGYTVTKLDSGKYVARDAKTGRFISAKKAPEVRVALSKQRKAELSG